MQIVSHAWCIRNAVWLRQLTSLSVPQAAYRWRTVTGKASHALINLRYHDDVMETLSHYWPFERGIHRFIRTERPVMGKRFARHWLMIMTRLQISLNAVMSYPVIYAQGFVMFRIPLLIGLTSYIFLSLKWRHNEPDGVSNYRRLYCLLSRLFRRRTKKTSKLASLAFVRGIHRWPVDSPHKGQ